MADQIRILILEDEDSAARSLQKAISRLWDPESFVVLEVLETISAALEYFAREEEPDLLFMDIQLSDGISFDLFESYQPKCPIIFTTAYSEYAIKAFEVNGLHYLLKPLEDNDLKSALDRFQNQTREEKEDGKLQALLESFKSPPFKENFLVFAGDSMKLIPTDEIALFQIIEKGLWLSTFKGEKFKLGKSLDEVEMELDTKRFYRANRQIILQKKAIIKIELYFNQKLIVQAKPDPKLRIVISKEKGREFKSWLEK